MRSRIVRNIQLELEELMDLMVESDVEFEELGDDERSNRRSARNERRSGGQDRVTSPDDGRLKENRDSGNRR